MNGVLSLGHFCETHGPCVMLCTQAISEAHPSQPPHSLTVPWCNACKSIEVNEAFVSHDGLADATYVTTRTALKQDMAFLLKQACVRSLSCEEETGKEGGTVYFGDCERGHVLSYTFRLPDSLARGFHRLFTIILLMRDKVHLLNSWPFITAHVRELINHLKENAQRVNVNEQSERSQRVHRLATGTPVGSPRSLVQLTNQPGVFGHIHLWFTWILKAGAQVITEQTNMINPPPWLGSETDEGFTLVQIAKVPSVSDCTSLTSMNIRELCRVLNPEKFQVLCYCVLLGLQVVIRGKQEIVASILNVLSTLLPKNWCRKMPYSEEYLQPDVCNFLGVGLHIAVPQPNDTIVRLDIVDNNYHLKWTGILPNKLPNLLLKLIKAIEDDRLQNDVLNIQISVFIEEWSNNAQTLFWAQANNSPDKLDCLMRVLGVQPCDKILMKYWILQVGLYSKAPCI